MSLGQGLLTILGSGASGIGSANPGLAGARFAGDVLAQRDRQFNQQKAYARQEKTDQMAERRMKLAEQASERQAQISDFNIDRTLNSMDEVAYSKRQASHRSTLLGGINEINMMPGVISGNQTAFTEKDLVDADDRSGFSKDVSELEMSMAYAAQAAESENPVMKKKYEALRDKHGKGLIEYKDNNGKLSYKVQGQPWKMGDNFEDATDSLNVF